MRFIAALLAAVVTFSGSAGAEDLKWGTVPWAGAIQVQPGKAPVAASKPAAKPAGHAVLASFYREGKITASGERFVPMALTAAHRWLPFGTKVRVTDPRSGQSVVVRINDRGPFIRGVSLGLSLGAARAIGLERRGVGSVTMEVLSDIGVNDASLVAKQYR